MALVFWFNSWFLDARYHWLTGCADFVYLVYSNNLTFIADLRINGSCNAFEIIYNNWPNMVYLHPKIHIFHQFGLRFCFSSITFDHIEPLSFFIFFFFVLVQMWIDSIHDSRCSRKLLKECSLLFIQICQPLLLLFRIYFIYI